MEFKSVKSILSSYNKEAKREVILEGVFYSNYDRIPTGIFQLDYSMGGGVPRGRVSILFGPESSAKTTLSLFLIANAQKMYPDKIAVFVDVEGHFDPVWAAKMGVDTEKLVYVLPSSAEETIDVVESLLYGEDLSLLVVDSLAAMVTEVELDKSASQALVGNTGLAINKLYRKTGRALGVAKMHGNYPTVVLINQLRSKIGVLYGDPDVMPGGKSFLYASSMTVRLYGKAEVVSEVHATLPAYRKVSAVIRKQKVPIIATKCEFLIAMLPIAKFDLKVGEVNSWGFILNYLKNVDLLVKDKTWMLTMTDTGECLEFGKQDEVRDMYVQNPEFAHRLRECILKVGYDSIQI